MANFGKGSHKFIEATFQSKSIFNNAWFRECTLDLSNASFCQLGQFLNTKVVGQCKFVWPGFGEKFTSKDDADGKTIARGTMLLDKLRFRKNCILDLRRNQLQSDVKLYVHNTNMAHLLLEETDCSQIHFQACTWPHVKDKFLWGLVEFKRDAVGDEYQNRNGNNRKFRPQLTRQTYLQLAKRFRDYLDFPRANEFDRGAFEMRRESSIIDEDWQGKSNFRWLSVYKYASHYSGNLSLPIFWLLLGLLIVFPIIFVIADPFHAVIPFGWEYNNSYFDLNFVGDIVVFSIQSAFSFGLTTTAQDDLANWSKVFQILERLFSITMITLFVFALRRRFKH